MCVSRPMQGSQATLSSHFVPAGWTQTRSLLEFLKPTQSGMVRERLHIECGRRFDSTLASRQSLQSTYATCPREAGWAFFLLILFPPLWRDATLGRINIRDRLTGAEVSARVERRRARGCSLPFAANCRSISCVPYSRRHIFSAHPFRGELLRKYAQ